MNLKCYIINANIDFLFEKNILSSCHSVNKFAEMAKRTRHEYLTEMCQKHLTVQTVANIDSSLSSNSLQSFKKLLTLSSTGSSDCSKNRNKTENEDSDSNHQFPYPGHILNGVKDPPTLNGAIMFSEKCAGSSIPSRLYVHDYYSNRDVEVCLLLSNEAILVIEKATMEIIWAVPVTSIIGWTDSRGVFATSTNNVISTIDICQSNKTLSNKKSKSIDCDTLEITANNNCLAKTSRELRLYYHQGECIHIMQKPIFSNFTTNSTELQNINSKCLKQYQQQQINQRNNDPFLMLIRVLELITRKSELRAIVIKRKSSSKSTKSVATTNSSLNIRKSSPTLFSPIEPTGTCGGDFGFQMKISNGIVEEIYDQTLSDYHLVPGCKVIEVDKISFAAMAIDELNELINSSLIMCLTFTGYDFARLQPRCNCPWPKALQLQHKQKV